VLPLKIATDSLARYDSTFNPGIVNQLRNIQKTLKIRAKIKYQETSSIYEGVKTIAKIIDSSSVFDSIFNSYEKLLINPVMKNHVKGFGIAKLIVIARYFHYM